MSTVPTMKFDAQGANAAWASFAAPGITNVFTPSPNMFSGLGQAASAGGKAAVATAPAVTRKTSFSPDGH